MHPVVYAADIGSIARGHFGWARVDPVTDAVTAERGGGTEIDELVDAIAVDLQTGRSVALGFECPLMVPVPLVPKMLGTARAGDGDRSWSAGAGVSVLATGIAQTAWILSTVRIRCPKAAAYLDWERFCEAENGLFLWEAFVTGAAKATTGVDDALIAVTTHVDDALVAAHTFVDALPDPLRANGVTADRPLSLVGAALLWSDWTTDPAVLHEPCLVIKSAPAPPLGEQPQTSRPPPEVAGEAVEAKAKSMTTTPHPSATKLCGCGCGEPVQRRFLQGHDAKLKSRLLRATKLGDAEAKRQLHELGWLPPGL